MKILTVGLLKLLNGIWKDMINNLLEKIKENYLVSYIYLYIFLMPWNFSNGQMGVLSVILLVWWLSVGKRDGYFSRLKDIIKFKPLLLLLIFFAYAYLTLLWTSNIPDAMEVFKFYKYYWIIIPVFFSVLTKEQAENGFYIFIFSIGLYSIFSILIYLSLIHVKYSGPANPRGILAHAIITPYMAIGLLSSILIAIYSKTKYIKIIFTVLALTSLIALLINIGRAGHLAFLITLFILIFVYRKQLFSIKLFIAFTIIFVGSIYILNETNKLDNFERGFYEIKDLQNNHFSGSWGVRAYMWYAAADIIKEDPILGVGAGDNIDVFLEYTKTHPSEATWLRTFHNQHLDLLTRYGIVGFSLFWASVVWLLYSLKNHKLFFTLGLIFFSITFFDSFGDIILLMKPYNNVFMLVFILLSIISYNKQSSIKTEGV